MCGKCQIMKHPTTSIVNDDYTSCDILFNLFMPNFTCRCINVGQTKEINMVQKILYLKNFFFW